LICKKEKEKESCWYYQSFGDVVSFFFFFSFSSSFSDEKNDKNLTAGHRWRISSPYSSLFLVFFPCYFWDAFGRRWEQGSFFLLKVTG
jgi:hypothetical protein